MSNSLLLAIGNTPLLKLTKIVSPSFTDVWIKYEDNLSHFNKVYKLKISLEVDAIPI